MKSKKTYRSVQYKNFRQAMIHLLETDFQILGSGQVLELLADNILRLIQDYYPDRVPPGTTLISAISKDAPKGHHRGVKGLPQVPVKLDVITEDIIRRYAGGERVRDIKKSYVIDLFTQAYRQGGVLSCSDVAILAKMSAATISKYVREHMTTHEEIIPTRGFIHDIGPSISHKGIIVGKYLQGTLPDKIARQTNHSQTAVDRYIRDYERVKLCLTQNMDTTLIHRTTGLSTTLIKRYTELYHTNEGEPHE